MTTFTITGATNWSSLTRLGSVAGIGWTRSTTTATVTQTGHGMVTGDLFNVTTTSDAAAVTVGVKSITFISANTFSFTCLNAGSTSGTVTANPIDDYLINGGTLTVDTHTRYGPGANLLAAFGDITMSASLGGSVEIDSTKVRFVRYKFADAGALPAYGTTISQSSGASGVFLGRYAAMNVAPNGPGDGIGDNGTLLIRGWNSVPFVADESLIGVNATCAFPDSPGFLQIVGFDGLTCTVNRLNTFKVRGDYFDFFDGTTSGVWTSLYQIPTNGAALNYFPGVWVETGAATGVYEFYPNAGSIAGASVASDTVRGKVCWIGVDGQLTFRLSAAGGYLPPAGLRLRIPNVFFQNCTQAAPAGNVLPNATLATRYEFATSGGGVIDIDKASMNWYLNLAQPYSVALTNSSTFEAIVLSECASPIAWSNVGVGQSAANTQIAFTMSLNFAGGTIADMVLSRAAQAGSGTYVAQFTDIAGFTFTGMRLCSFAKAGNAASGSFLKTRVTNSSFTNTTLGGGRVAMVGCADLTYTDTVYYDHPLTTTGTAIPMNVWDYSGAPSFRIKMDGLTFGGLTLVQPYAGIVTVQVAGCKNLTLRNLGTAAAPLDCGGAYVDATWTRATTTMTVTKVAHGLKAADIVAVMIASDVAPKAVTTTTATLWTVLAAPTADTFTVTVTNAGATSGTLSYYPTMVGSLIIGLAGGAPANVRAQRCYTIGMRGQALPTADNSSKGITFENVWLTDWATQALPLLNAKFKGILSNMDRAAQTSVYGTHFFDYYVTGVPPSLSGLTWNRVTTVATVTLAGHNLKTGDTVVVTVSSATAAIVLGAKTITATTSGAFTFTCLNAGATSGTLTIEPSNSRISIAMNEPTADTLSQVTLTNGARFTSAGGLYMPVIGHQADFVAPDNIRGHSSFPIQEAVMSGGTIANYDITYSMDGGVTYKNLYYPRLVGGGASASTNVTMTSTTGVAVGDYVWGTNIAPNAKVVSITNGTTVVVDIANIGTVSGALRFSQLPSQTVADPLVGFPLRVRIKTTTTNATAITSLVLLAASTTAARAATYPLDTNKVTFTGLPTGCDAVVLTAGTSTILAQQDAGAGTTFVYTYEGTPTVDVGFIKTGYVPFYIRNLSLTAADSSIPVTVTPDRNFS